MQDVNVVTLTLADVSEKAAKFYNTSKVVVLDGNWTPIGKATWEDAASDVYTGKAKVIAFRDRSIHPEFNMPLVIRFNKDIRGVWKEKVPWGKTNTHIRDRWTCQFCGEKVTAKNATIDHVIPQAQGGKNGWLNTVCSCFACNNFKEDRTPKQAHMTLLRQPYQPTISEFIKYDIEDSGGMHLLEIVWDKMMGA